MSSTDSVSRRIGPFAFHPLKAPAHLKHRAHWLLIHVAMIFFFCDLIGAAVPSFRQWWESMSHLGVAVAAFCATAAEYISE